MGNKSSFPNKQLGHAGLNPSETVATADTWRRLREDRHAPAEVGDFRSQLAPWAAVRRPAPTPTKAATAPTTSPTPITVKPPVQPARDAVIAEDAAHRAVRSTANDTNMQGTKIKGLSGTTFLRPPLRYPNPEPRPKGSIIAPQYGRPNVADIDYKDGAIIDHEVIQAEGALMKSQRRRLQEARLRQQTQNER
jgi:hypothetical protein